MPYEFTWILTVRQPDGRETAWGDTVVVTDFPDDVDRRDPAWQHAAKLIGRQVCDTIAEKVNP